jgi:hypothetical protein
MKALVDVMDGKQNINDVFHLGGLFAFTPSIIPESDWALILEELAPDYSPERL